MPAFFKCAKCLQPSQVYEIENIISLNDMAALEENSLILMADEPDVEVDKFKQFSDYFTKEFKRLKSTSLDKEEKLQRVKALLYTEGLIKFSAIKKKSITPGVLDESLPTAIPDTVKRSIREKFSCKQGPTWFVLLIVIFFFTWQLIVLFSGA